MLKVYSEINRSKENLIDLIDKIAQIDSDSAIDRSGFFNILSILVPQKTDDLEIKNIKRKAYNHIKTISEENNPKINDWIVSNQNFLKNVISSIQNKIFVAYEKNSDFNINKYDIIIFDADKTIWKGESAFQMVPPFISISEDTVQDSEGKTISLRNGVKETMIKIRALGIDIGIISHSENKDLDAQDQPVLEILRILGIRDLINENIVVMADFPKSMFIPKERKTLFIDDQFENLLNVFNFSKADVIDAQEVKFDNNSNHEKSSSLNKDQKIKIAFDNQENVEKYIKEVYSQGFINPLNDREVVLGWIKVELEPIKTGVILKSIESMSPGKGEASKVLDYLTKLADEMGVNLSLFAVPTGKKNLSKKDLMSWYGRNGFETTQGDRMERQPRESVESDLNKEAKRNYIPKSERPDRPEDGKEYELDHKKPRWKGGKDTKRNLQWVEKNKHKNKSSEEGSFEYGGKDRHSKLKEKGEKGYSKYQSETAKKKIEKEKEDLGDKGFSKLQSERAKKRWSKNKK